MSLFLGPIHYIMYDKIKFQNEFINYLLTHCNDEKFSSEMNEKISPISDEPLENIIDTTNIHGSLQEMVTKVEKKLALVTSEIIRRNLLTKEDLIKLSFEFGKNHQISTSEVMDTYNFLSNNLLNGMPCDRVQEIVEQDENLIKWQDRIDIRSDYWQDVDMDSSIFYDMRTAIIDGMLKDSNIVFDFANGIYEMRLK